MPQTKFLLTYFEPFGGSETNISQQVAEEIVADGLIKCCLPVSFKRAPEVLQEALKRYQPESILSLGQCAEADKIRLERLAINMMDSTKGDNDGCQPSEQTIDANAPLALRTGLNIKQLQTVCTAAGLPTILSNSAGLYVCNRIYFEALRYTPRALFVHVPKNMDPVIAKNTILFICKQFV